MANAGPFIGTDSAEDSDEEAELTGDMVNLFVRLEVQRRYFNVVAMEMLSKSFGMEQPSSLEALIPRSYQISLDKLIKCGRGFTVEQFLEAKSDFYSDDKKRKQLIRDRETFLVYKAQDKNHTAAKPKDNKK